MLVEFTKAKEGMKYVMAKKNLKREVQLLDRNLEVLSLQSMATPSGSNEGLNYLVMFHSKCFRLFSIAEELVTKPFAEAFKDVLIPELCSQIKSKRENADMTASVAVILGQKVYSLSCSKTGRFPSKSEVEAYVEQGAQAILTLS